MSILIDRLIKSRVYDDIFNDGNDGFEFHLCDTDSSFPNRLNYTLNDESNNDDNKCSPRLINDTKLYDDINNTINEINKDKNDDKCYKFNESECNEKTDMDRYINSMTEDELNQSLRMSQIKFNHPLLLAYINSLNNIKYDSEIHTYYDHCPISFTDFNNGDYIKILQCRHYFDPESIVEWLNSNPRCPVCNYDLKENLG